jgi:hypothetical protein
VTLCSVKNHNRTFRMKIRRHLRSPLLKSPCMVSRQSAKAIIAPPQYMRPSNSVNLPTLQDFVSETPAISQQASLQRALAGVEKVEHEYKRCSKILFSSLPMTDWARHSVCCLGR